MIANHDSYERQWVIRSHNVVFVVNERFTREGAFSTLSQRTKAVDPNQHWYWSPRWQAEEQEADLDWAAGRYTDFSSLEVLLAATVAPQPLNGAEAEEPT